MLRLRAQSSMIASRGKTPADNDRVIPYFNSREVKPLAHADRER